MKEFFRLIEKQKWFVLLALLLLFLPGENLYEQLRRQTREPLVKEKAVDLPQPVLYPVNQTGQSAPFLTAKSVVVLDLASKTALLVKNPQARLAPASTTKIMTALVALETYQLTDVLIAPRMPTEIGQQMNLAPGEQITVENLLYGLLVQSANDAALTLAANYDSGEEKFIERMNQKAEALGLKNSHFANATGFDDPNHYSSSYDLAHLTAAAIANPLLARIFSTRQAVVADVSQSDYHALETTNELIGQVLGLQGVKTGWTELAGECLISLVNRDDRQIITVLLGSEDRFGETASLINWVFKNYQWQAVILSIPD